MPTSAPPKRPRHHSHPHHPANEPRTAEPPAAPPSLSHQEPPAPLQHPPGMAIEGFIADLIALELKESTGGKLDLHHPKSQSRLLGKLRMAICEPLDHSKPGAFVSVRPVVKEDGKLAVLVETDNADFVRESWVKALNLQVSRQGSASYRISINNHLPVEQNQRVLNGLKEWILDTSPQEAGQQVGAKVARNTLTLHNPTPEIRRLLENWAQGRQSAR